MDDPSVANVPTPSPAGETAPSPRTPSPRPRAPLIRRIVAAFLALAVTLAFAGSWAYDTLPRRLDSQETFVLGQTEFAPGDEGAVRVMVRNSKDAQPVPNANVKVSLVPASGGRATLLYTGRADEQGTLAATFTVPASAQVTQTLLVETNSPLGEDQVRQPVTVQRSYRLLLTTDKPVYQPGQTVHMRALALSTLDMRAAAAQEVGFLVEDPKGNKVFRRTVATSDFGVAAADFDLATEVLNGDYKVSVTLADTTSEKTVAVKPYVLPKFAVKVSTERSYYLPGEHVAGTVQCDYFFGKPVSGGDVQIAGSVFDVQETQVVSLQGRTDEAGTYRFEFDLPQFFAGGGLEGGQAEFSLQVSVVDQAEHTEQANRVLPIAEQPIAIEVVPEAGVLKPGVENRLYVLTSYPDGMPARTRLDLSVDNQAVPLTTGDYGLAEYAFVPRGATRLSVVARDEQGRAGQASLELGADTSAEVVLLRPDRATYHLGDTMNLLALTSGRFGSLFLDIVKDGHTLSTRSAPVEDGRAEFAVDLSGDLYGALALHAYKVQSDGSIIRDTRIVVVDAPRDLTTEIRADHEVYRPGDTAQLSFSTRAATGPVPAALGVAVVDESVFAVMEQDPGFAKLYFLLRQELLEPKYQIKGFTLPEVLTVTTRPQLQTTPDQAARAAWATIPAGAMTLNVNSRPLKIAAAQQARLTGLNRVSNLTLVALILVPLGLWVTVILGLWAAGVLGKAMSGFGLVTVLLMVVLPFACPGLFLVLALLANGLPYQAGQQLVTLILAGFLLGWLASFVALAIYAWWRRDESARIVWLLVTAWVALGVALLVTLTRRASPSTGLSVAALLAYLAGLLALILFAVGLYVRGRRWAGVSAFGLVLLFVPAMIAAAALPQALRGGRLVQTLGNPMVYVGPVGWLTGCAPGGPGGDFDLRSLPFPSSLGLMEKSAGIAPQATPAPAPGEAPEQELEATEQQAPRLRQFFPETLLWLPELQTDAGGRAELAVPLADSITTWRVTALASTQDGQLGFSNAALRVFQDFFVDIDLPVALTQNDEVAIPVAVYNYLPQAQNVRLEVAQEDWFELQDAATKTLLVEANDIEVVYFRIRVLRFGQQGFQVTAIGEQMSDAIRREVAVVPDGRQYRKSKSDWLRRGATIATVLPEQAITGTQRIEVKIYPGVVAQVVEGLEKILRLPHG